MLTKEFKMLWKYGMIKVGVDHCGAEEDEDICELVELFYEETEAGIRYQSFGRPYLSSIEQLRNATRDVERDGIITWFWDNGTFRWNNTEYFWDWSRNE
jgi:hypothetical protein